MDVNAIKKQLNEVASLAEKLSKVDLLTGVEAKMRIAAKNVALKRGYLNEEDEFVPPREVLLYLVR